MADRLDLQAILVEVLGSANVYFSPPPTIIMTYPCIVYKRGRIKTRFSGNKPYDIRKAYELTFISLDPDSEIVDKIAALPMCVHDRFFTNDELNHDVFSIYF